MSVVRQFPSDQPAASRPEIPHGEAPLFGFQVNLRTYSPFLVACLTSNVAQDRIEVVFVLNLNNRKILSDNSV